MISPRPVEGFFFPKKLSNLRSGDRITLKAVRPLQPSIWQVSFRGKLFPVTSTVKLEAGKMYGGRIFWKGDTLVFKTDDPSGNDYSRGAPRAFSVVEKSIIQILQSLNMPVHNEAVQWIGRKAGPDNNNLKTLRILAQLYDKQIEITPDEAGIDPHTLFPSREKHEENKRRNNQGPPPRQDEIKSYEEIKNGFKEMLKKQVSKKGNSPLQLFNHLRSGHDHWVIIPIGYRAASREVNGSLRCKIDIPGKQVQKVTIALSLDGEEIAFTIPDYCSKHPVLKIFGNKGAFEGANPAFLEEFSEKLSKLGIELDDTINSDNNFDGFEEISNNGLKTVDTVI